MNVELLKRLADEYAHVYSFVEDDTMPLKRKELHEEIDRIARLCEAKDAAIQLAIDSANVQEVAHFQQLSEANALIAMQQEAMKALTDICVTQVGADYNDIVHAAFKLGEQAISASAESVAAWETKKLEPMQRQVAMLRKALTEAGRNEPFVPFAKSLITEALSNTQATALAYEREVKARALMDLVTGLDNEEDVSAWYVREQAKRWGN